MDSKYFAAWLVRFLKGIVIGTGAILPGVSGGVLAAIFHVYERMIAFLSDIRRDFAKNFFYFLPIAIGGLAGIFLLSFAVDYLLKAGQAQVIWFFIGCVIGTLPLLFNKAGRDGRKAGHFIALFISFSITLAILFLCEALSSGFDTMPHNMGTWALSGVIVGLGAIVPGLSPSNFLIYFNLYEPMVEGISKFDLSVFVPVMLGCAICIILLSKVISILLNRMYSAVFHIILGIIIASTVKIVPIIDYFSAAGLLCAATLAAGILLGLWMSALEKKYNS